MLVVSFFFIFQFPELQTFFKNDKRFAFPMVRSKIISVDGHRNPPEFDHDRTELADMDNSECKANFILKT